MLFVSIVSIKIHVLKIVTHRAFEILFIQPRQ